MINAPEEVDSAERKERRRSARRCSGELSVSSGGADESSDSRAVAIGGRETSRDGGMRKRANELKIFIRSHAIYLARAAAAERRRPHCHIRWQWIALETQVSPGDERRNLNDKFPNADLNPRDATHITYAAFLRSHVVEGPGDHDAERHVRACAPIFGTLMLFEPRPGPSGVNYGRDRR
jgi:hypothetical protein